MRELRLGKIGGKSSFFFFFFQNYEKAFLVSQPIYLVKCIIGMWASALHSKYEM